MVLILQHDLALDGVGVSGDLRAFSIDITADSIEVPATAGRRWKDYKNGALSATITLTYHQSELPTSITEMFYDAILTNSGEVDFSGKMTDDSDLRWEGTFNVTSFLTGGTVYEVGEHSVTFPITANSLQRSAAGS